MPEEKMRTIAYICPKCRQSVVGSRSVFALYAAPTTITCSCKGSSLHIENFGDRFQMSVPCLFCGDEHSAVCSEDAFLQRRALVFSCKKAGVDCCYVGEEENVLKAIERLKKVSEKLESSKDGENVFLDEIIMHEVLSELRDIAARGGISCACGSNRWEMRIHFSSVELICTDCGAKLRLPAATDEDIDHLCCRNSIMIMPSCD